MAATGKGTVFLWQPTVEDVDITWQTFRRLQGDQGRRHSGRSQGDKTVKDDCLTVDQKAYYPVMGQFFNDGDAFGKWDGSFSAARRSEKYILLRAHMIRTQLGDRKVNLFFNNDVVINKVLANNQNVQRLDNDFKMRSVAKRSEVFGD